MLYIPSRVMRKKRVKWVLSKSTLTVAKDLQILSKMTILTTPDLDSIRYNKFIESKSAEAPTV